MAPLFYWLVLINSLSLLYGESHPDPMSEMKEALDEFRVREISSQLPNDAFTGIRITKPLKQRLVKLAMSQGVTESTLARFLILQGLAAHDIDGLRAG